MPPSAMRSAFSLDPRTGTMRVLTRQRRSRRGSTSSSCLVELGRWQTLIGILKYSSPFIKVEIQGTLSNLPCNLDSRYHRPASDEAHVSRHQRSARLHFLAIHCRWLGYGRLWGLVLASEIVHRGNRIFSAAERKSVDAACRNRPRWRPVPAHDLTTRRRRCLEGRRYQRQRCALGQEVGSRTTRQENTPHLLPDTASSRRTASGTCTSRGRPSHEGRA